MDHTLILTLESHLTKLMYFLILTLQWMKKTWTMTLLQWYAVEMIIPEKTKRTVIPDALKVLRFQPGHKYCLLGRLSHEVGWNHYDTIKGLGHVVQNSTQYPLVVSTWPFIEAVQAAWKAAENGFSAVDLVVEGCSACEELRCDGTDWSIVW